MVSIADFKEIKGNFANKFKEFIENDFYTDFKYHSEEPHECIQYWEVSLMYFDEDVTHTIENTIGYFTISGFGNHRRLNINKFFETNDKVTDEFYSVYETGAFSRLLDIFTTSNQRLADGSIFSIHISSFSNSEEEYIENMCQEFIISIFLDCEKISLDCMLNERYTIKAATENQINFFRIPFDKVCFFKGAERVEKYEKKEHYKKRFKIAVSFAGEYRDSYIEHIMLHLQIKGFSKDELLYDMYHKAEFARPNLDIHLRNLYSKESELVVIFLSKEYNTKTWTGIEYRSIRPLINERTNDELIMLFRFDDSEIDGLHPSTDGSIDANLHTPEAIAELIDQRYKLLKK